VGSSGRGAIRLFGFVCAFATMAAPARGAQAGRSRDPSPSPAPSASDPLGERVLVVYNSNERDSKRLADHYAEVRAIPTRNVMGVAFTNRDELDWSEYTGGVRRAIQARLDDPKLLYVVLSYLTPWRMVNSPLPQCWQDRIGLFRVGDSDQAPALGWKTTDSSKSGSLS